MNAAIVAAIKARIAEAEQAASQNLSEGNAALNKGRAQGLREALIIAGILPKYIPATFEK